MIDQSPIAFDDIIFRDLTADFSAKLDQQCLTGTGANGQMLGVLNTPNIQTVAVSSLDIKGIYSSLVNAIQLVHTTRYQPPEVIVTHPRRWAWLLSLLDTNNRPLFAPDDNGPFNAAGVLTDVASQQVVGRSHGLPMLLIPTSRPPSAWALTRTASWSCVRAILSCGRAGFALASCPRPGHRI